MQRDFNLRRLGQLTLDVRCVDIFNTNKTDATIYGIRELTVHNPARRTFLTISPGSSTRLIQNIAEVAPERSRKRVCDVVCHRMMQIIPDIW